MSSCEINSTLGAITCSDGTVIGTLGDGTVIVTLRDAIDGTYLGTIFVLGFFGFFGCCGCMLLNSVASLLMVLNWISPIVKGVLGIGFLGTCINFLATLVALYVVDNPGMIRCSVNNFTTSICLSSLVFGV